MDQRACFVPLCGGHGALWREFFIEESNVSQFLHGAVRPGRARRGRAIICAVCCIFMWLDSNDADMSDPPIITPLPPWTPPLHTTRTAADFPECGTRIILPAFYDLSYTTYFFYDLSYTLFRIARPLTCFATDTVCCSIASLSTARVESSILSNSSMQQIPWSDSTNAPDSNTMSFVSGSLLI